MTQNKFILKHLKAGNKLTTLIAHRYGICRISERARELEKIGHKIRREWKRVPGRFGWTRVVEYSMGRK